LLIPTGVKGSCNVAALAEPFNTGWYYQPVLKGAALAPVNRTGPGLKGGSLVLEGQHRLGNRGNRSFWPVLMSERVAVCRSEIASVLAWTTGECHENRRDAIYPIEAHGAPLPSVSWLLTGETVHACKQVLGECHEMSDTPEVISSTMPRTDATYRHLFTKWSHPSSTRLVDRIW